MLSRANLFHGRAKQKERAEQAKPSQAARKAKPHLGPPLLLRALASVVRCEISPKILEC